MKRNKKGQFVKGNIPWCKGTKGILKAWNKNKNCPQLSGNRNGMYGVDRSGKKAPNFKFDILKQELYNLYWSKNLSQVKIGKIFGCSGATIKNNLIKYNIPRKSISKACKGRPSSFKGKHHNKKSKEKLRLANLGNKPFLNKKHSLETKLLFSKQRKGRILTEDWKRNIRRGCQGINEGNKNGMFGKTSKYERIKYEGIWMRSSYEIKFACFLDCSGIKWLYESRTFDLENTTYTPDFYIPEWNLYIEIKGYWYKGSKERFNKFKKLYPKVRIKVLQQKELQSMGVLI